MKIWRIGRDNRFHNPQTDSDEHRQRLTSLGLKGTYQGEWKVIRLQVINSNHPDDTPTMSSDTYLKFGRIPLFTDKALSVLQSLVSAHIEIFPCYLLGEEVDLHAVSVINHIDNCIRWDRAAEIEYWRNSTKLKRLRPLVLNANAVRDQHIFMLTEWLTSGVYVSDEFKDAVERNQLTGLTFQPIGVI
jgi:hypothetical protein